MLIRQGDILLKLIGKLPEGLKEKDKVLAYGEVTGHSHRFEDASVKVFDNGNGTQYAQLTKPAQLIHEEHQDLEIPIGVYEVVIQREFDLLEGVRQVMD